MSSIIEERITAHMETIEAVYGIAILNKKEIAAWIANSTDDEKNALTIATSLNTWVMINSTGESINIPLSAVRHIQENLNKFVRS